MQIVNFVLKDTLTYDNVPVISYTINYPQFQSTTENSFINEINDHYRQNAYELTRYVKDTLYKQAVEQYNYSKENNYPIIPYEVFETYKITYLMDCYISLYFDQYMFTGGAHGNTVRRADTWNICENKKMELKDFFPNCPDYKEQIITYIINDITDQLKDPKAQGTYFDSYAKDVATAFNEESFYLTEDGIVIYFGQYDIAPYSSGIREFLLPYLC